MHQSKKVVSTKQKKCIQQRGMVLALPTNLWILGDKSQTRSPNCKKPPDKNIKGDFQGAKGSGILMGGTNTTIKPAEETDSQRLVASEGDRLCLAKTKSSSRKLKKKLGGGD